MKKIYVLSTLALLTVGLLVNPSTPVNEVKENNDIEEVALDLNNESLLKLDTKNVAIGEGDLDVSKTYVQFGMIEEDGKDLYVMRFATAVKGDLRSVTYTRAEVEGKEENKKDLIKVKSEAEAEVKKHAAAYTKVLATSSEKNIGIDELRVEIATFI